MEEIINNKPKHKVNNKTLLRKFDVDYFNKFLKEFQNESDRGAAIVGAAFLEDCLRTLLRNFLIADKGNVEQLLGSEKKRGFLSGLNANATTAYCLGLISADEYYDLQLISSIRNRFAHHLHGLSFKDKLISEKCNNLKWPTILDPEKQFNGPRNRFNMAISVLITIIGVEALNVENEKRKIKFMRL